jgi:hypothetical protein
MEETSFQLRYAQAAADAGIDHPPLVLYDDVQRLIDESAHEWICGLIGSLRQATILSDGLQDLAFSTFTMNADGDFFLLGACLWRSRRISGRLGTEQANRRASSMSPRSLR